MEVDRRLEQQLLILMLINSLRREGVDGQDDVAAANRRCIIGGSDARERIDTEIMSLTSNLSAVISKELLIIAQQLIDAQLLDLLSISSDEGRAASVESMESCNQHSQQLRKDEDETTAAAQKKMSRGAAKRKRNRRNKAAAKHKKTRRMSWISGAGIIPQIIVMAFSSITTLIVTLAIIHQNVDGSIDGNDSPALPPTTSRSTSLRHRQMQRSDRQSSYANNDVASTPPIIITDPSIAPSTKVEDEASLIMIPFTTNQPTISLPTQVPTDSTLQQICLDTPNWTNEWGGGCDIYEWEPEGCPLTGNDAIGIMGPATENCCHCGGGSITLPPTISRQPSASPTLSAAPSISTEPSVPPSLSANPTELCLDTPDWKDGLGQECDSYKETSEPGCFWNGALFIGDMGSANEHCCYCNGGIRTCEDYRSLCQTYFSVSGVKDGVLTSLCEEADSCPCNGVDHDVKILQDLHWGSSETTVGLHNECNCNYWLRLCTDTGEGIACDYAAEYCCGDYKYTYAEFDGWYFDEITALNSPTCYCDFFKYAQAQFDHLLVPQRLDMQTNITIFNHCDLDLHHDHDAEIHSLEAIYKNTNGQHWTNNAGWMDDTIPHCQWYGISCYGYDGSVSEINLRGNNLQGYFPLYTRNVTLEGNPVAENDWQKTKYGLSNLYYLETLDLAENKLIGTIDSRPLYNLKSLHHFDISDNQLSGGIDPLITPSISYANFSNNRFTSIYRMEPYKVSPLQTLRSLDVSNNEIEIDATDLLENIPHSIEHFISSNNNIHGKLPASLNNLPQLRRFGMSSNSLSGELPSFDDSISSLQILDISNQYQANGLTGSIPEVIWRFQSLKILNLAGNKLTGIIPVDIVNLAVLQRLDLYDNRLSGQIPPQIGQLAGTLNYLSLAKNNFIGTIPSQLGELEDASVHLKDNSFDISTTSPLSLCILVRVKFSDLADDVTLCPIERTALSNFYDAAKGGEWTNGTKWNDDYASHCDWHGVQCDENEKVTELILANNGLSGRLSSSIGHLSVLKVLDLSDNDIKGSIPTDIGQLHNLNYLRLSYNAFIGKVPEELVNLKNLELLQLQSNRITEVPSVTILESGRYNKSAFVTDCGTPSIFDEVLACINCTMCCNANEGCYPQENSRVEEWGLNYSTFAAVLLAGFTVFSCMFVLFLYYFGKNSSSTLTMSMERRLQLDDNYVLSTIGKDSVYSYFVTDKVLGWLVALATLVAQSVILTFFVIASEVNLGGDKIDLEFTWKCPRDSDVCSDTSDLEKDGWMIFSVLMVAFLAKDMINGWKLIYHSSKRRHPLWTRMRYFVSGLGLCSITLFAFYVSTIYNKAIATTNTAIIVNAVVVLFVMDMDEYIFAAIEATNSNWTKHAEKGDDSDGIRDEKGSVIDEMKDEIAMQKEQIEFQQQQNAVQDQKIASLEGELRKMEIMLQKMVELNSGTAALICDNERLV